MVMDIDWDDAKKYGSFVLIIMSLVIIVVSGIAFGITYFILDNIQTTLQSQDCLIANNSLVSTCQELFQISFYPVLALKDILLWANTFLIFGMVLGMLFLGYKSGRSPFLMGISLLLVTILTYVGIHVSNIYRTMLENDQFRAIMVDFVFYNRVMLHFPWFVFIVSLFSAMLGIINYQKTRINVEGGELDY